MSEKIKIKVHSHQQFVEFEGVPILWCQAIENYQVGDERYARPMQVPAVLLQTADGPKLIALQAQYSWTEIEPAGPGVGD